MSQLKIALAHDYIKEYGGAERVLETLHEIYPEAPVYTLVYAPQFLGPHKERFANWNICPSFLQQIPFRYKFISIFRLIAPFVFRTFDFSEYDVVIVSATGAYSPNTIRTKKRIANSVEQHSHQAFHICYCHTPPRYLYGYATARKTSENPMMKVLVPIMLHILRMVDFKSSENVDLFIANSHTVAARIKKFYRRDAVVVYPPVDVSNNQIPRRTGDFFLAGGRLARPKHIDLIIRACRELHVPLKVFGKGFAGYEEELKKTSEQNESGSHNENIEFLGEIRDEEKLSLMKNAKAFIFAAEDEDFGIVPVEAMGMGTPVIAYRSGGVQESVVENKTGVFFDELTEESLIQAIKKFEKGKNVFKKDDLIKHAEKFSKKRFIKEIQKIVHTVK